MAHRVFLLVLLLLPGFISAQTPDDVLATAKGRTFTSIVLSPEGLQLFTNRNAQIEYLRANLLSKMVFDGLLDLEAKATGSTPKSLADAVVRSIPNPSPTEVQAVYDANRAALGNRSLEEVRKEITEYIRRDNEQKALGKYVATLQTKYKYTAGKNLNAPGLKPTDVLATFGPKAITAQEFETANRIKLNDEQWHQYEDIKADLEIGVLNELIAEEAKARNIEPAAYIAAEVTDKMRTFADGEREELETALMNRLFAKYDVKFLLKEPPVISQNISVDDDPSKGPATAPVTVVMFSDFQCPACSRTHPVLKSVVGEFGDKVRFVVRDFPLESIHENAFAAAMAANAARAQGKYFEFIDFLYRNQSALGKELFVRYAAELGLNAKQFEIDLTSEKASAEIRKDIADGESYGVSGTPTIFVNGVKVHRLSAESFRRAINRTLAK